MTYRQIDGESKFPDSSGSGLESSLSTRVVFRLAKHTDQAVDTIRPLAKSIDPEALDKIFARRSANGASVTFRHEGYTITVTGDGDIRLDPIEKQ